MGTQTRRRPGTADTSRIAFVGGIPMSADVQQPQWRPVHGFAAQRATPRRHVWAPTALAYPGAKRRGSGGGLPVLPSGSAGNSTTTSIEGNSVQYRRSIEPVPAAGAFRPGESKSPDDKGETLWPCSNHRDDQPHNSLYHTRLSSSPCYRMQDLTRRTVRAGRRGESGSGMRG